MFLHVLNISLRISDSVHHPQGKVWFAEIGENTLQTYITTRTKPAPSGRAAGVSTSVAVGLFRVFRLLLGPLMKLSSVSVILGSDPCNSLYQHLLPDCEQANIVPKLLRLVIWSVFELVMESSVSDMNDNSLANANESSYLSQSKEQADETGSNASLALYIVRLCVDYTHAHQHTGMNEDIGFYDFCLNSFLCQWLPQSMRVEAWIRTVLLSSKSPNLDKLITCTYAAIGHGNTHTLHLLAFLGERANNKIALVDQSPAYSYLEFDNSINDQDLILQQCTQNNELNWNDLSYKWFNFPFSMNFLMSLLHAYHQPMKLLLLLSPLEIFRILENISVQSYATEIECMQEIVEVTEQMVAFQHIVCIICNSNSFFTYLISLGIKFASQQSAFLVNVCICFEVGPSLQQRCAVAFSFTPSF